MVKPVGPIGLGHVESDRRVVETFGETGWRPFAESTLPGGPIADGLPAAAALPPAVAAQGTTVSHPAVAVPAQEPIRRLRDRTRTTITWERSREVQCVEKLLEEPASSSGSGTTPETEITGIGEAIMLRRTVIAAGTVRGRCRRKKG